jgi:hypothetical protein
MLFFKDNIPILHRRRRYFSFNTIKNLPRIDGFVLSLKADVSEMARVKERLGYNQSEM